MYYVLIYPHGADRTSQPGTAPAVRVDSVHDDRGDAEGRYEECIDDPANANCWIEIASRQVRQLRLPD